MSDGSDGGARAGAAAADPGRVAGEATVEQLDGAECLRLVSQHEVGRIAYSGRDVGMGRCPHLCP